MDYIQPVGDTVNGVDIKQLPHLDKDPNRCCPASFTQYTPDSHCCLIPPKLDFSRSRVPCDIC